MTILNAKNGRITAGGRPVHLRGVNLGGWLMPEAYFMQAPNRPVSLFRRGFAKACGEAALRELETRFRDTFIVKEDLARIAALGFNSIRLPFHFNVIEESPYVYSSDGLAYLDRAIRWAKAYQLRVILDMHAAPGAQNHDWHSDSNGQAKFWTSRAFQKRASALWEFLADRYKDEPAIAGYDVLNETVLDPQRTGLMNRYYHAAIKAIRSSDKQHIIFLEGNRWAQDIACLDDFKDDNLAFSFHFYEPLEFTFNFVPGLRYPLIGKRARWDKAFMRGRIEQMVRVAKQRGRALWCGEFGVHARGGLYGEDAWVKDIVGLFNTHDIHWSYWTWKAVKNVMFPDGMNSYLPNDPWINRGGPLTGWETWHLHWKDKKKAMVASWKTDAFTPNKEIIKALRKGL
jgi:hypothetical protein